MRALGIDIGGSAVKGAPVDTVTGRLLAERVRMPTPKALTPPQMAAAVADIARQFRWKGPIGIGFPGVILGTRVLTAANLHRGFVGLDGGRLFSKATRCPVGLINDAAAAATAEMALGAGKGFAGKTLLLTLGTGVGSAIAYRGVVVPCEFGHLPLKGRAAEKRVAASVRKARNLSWKDWGKRLSEYIAILDMMIWPELIVIGGGVSAKSQKFFKFIKPRARLAAAQFLNEAGIVGAALCAPGAIDGPKPEV